jgi:hypothetical protein
MPVFARIAISVFASLVVYFVCYWFCFAQIISESASWLATDLALLTAALASWCAWKQSEAPGRGVFTTALRWAVVIGAIGFCGGFFGPMIFAPDANQGPLLGIFVTGPLGFIAGGIAGTFYGLWRPANKT